MAELKDTEINGNLNVSGVININNQNIFKLIYPVGCLYWSSRPDEPSTLFGGTWKRIKDTYVYAAPDGTSGNQGDTTTGGFYTITSNNLPEHTHGYKPAGTIDSVGTGISIKGDGGHDHGPGTYRIQGEARWAADRGLLYQPDTDRGNTYSGCVKPGTKAMGGIDYSGSTAYALVIDAHGPDVPGTSSWTGTTSWVNNHTHGVTDPKHKHTFTGTASSTDKNTTTKAAIKINPKHIIRYCWERTAL